MPSIIEMGETCRRLAAELQGSVDHHRLLEVETIVRLLMPHLTRAVADAIHVGRSDFLAEAGEQLVTIHSSLSAMDGKRDRSDSTGDQAHLLEAVRGACRVLNVLQSL